MEKLRSLSVPKKHFFQTGNPITHEPENPHFNPKRLNTVKDSDPSSIAESPIMRTEANLESREDFRDNYRSLPSQGSPYANSHANVHRSRPSGSWGEFIVKQGELAQAVDKNFRIEDKIRTLKYREALDQMIQDGKNKKMDMRREMKQPTHDPQQMQEFLRQEKIRELEDKRYYNNELQRVIKEKEDLRKKEQLQRQQEILEQRRMTEQLHEFEQRAYIQGKIDKKQTFNQYQAQIGLKQQTLQYHKHKEELDALEQNQFFAKQDEERRKLYEKIKTRADTQVSKPAHVVEREYEKYKQIENFINKSVQEKIEKDTIEMMRRNEAFKKAQHDASELNRKQAMERNLKSRNDKKTEHEEFGYSLEQRKFVDQMEHLRREQDLMQKRGYYESLKSQAQAREEAKIRENAMSNAERIVNFRRTRSPENFLEEASANSLPLNGRSYERNLQLRYIDNWLTNTTQNHQQNL